MIELYASSSPNVQKVVIFLEEAELRYRLRPVNVHQGEQYLPQFRALNPNAKVPVIVDHEGPGGAVHTVFESGAILLYLAEKTGRFLPSGPLERSTAIQWLMIQLTGIGPMFGQFNHFARFAKDATYGLERYASEMRRLYDLIDERLADAPFLGGRDYTIADIATFPWIRTQARLFGERYGALRQGWTEHPNIARWFASIEARPAVARAVVDIDSRPSTLGSASPEQLDRYFGRGAWRRRID